MTGTGDADGGDEQSRAADTRALDATAGVSPESNPKVLGENPDTEAAGVVGRTTDSTGTTYGVYGETQSEDSFAAGVRGEATNSSGTAAGVYGKTAGGDYFSSVGVYADARSVDGTAIEGDSQGGLGDGVRGFADADNFYAVHGSHTASSGSGAYGVYASTNSSDAPALYANGNGGGAVEADGHVDVGRVGCEAYLSSSEGIASGGYEPVPFDVAPVDHFGGFDVSAGTYTVQADGDYDVNAMIEWSFAFAGQTSYNTEIRVGGSPVADRIQEVAGPSSSASFVHPRIQKTLYGLSSGDVIDIRVFQNTGTIQDLSPDRESTYVTITKVG